MNRRPPNFEYYFLGIAIGKYIDKGLRTLNSTFQDVDRLRDILTHNYNFEDRHCLIIKDEEATKDNVVKRIERYSSLTSQTCLLIYFAGHGGIENEEGCWYLYDSNIQTKENILTVKDIEDTIKKVEGCKHVLLISDSCNSGKFAVKSQFRSSTSLTQKSFYRKSRWVLTSGSSDEKVSDGLDGELSIFANALITYLSKNLEDELSISTLAQNVKNEVTDISIDVHNRSQEPQYGFLFRINEKNNDGEFVFRLGKSEEELFRIGLKSNDLDDLYKCLKFTENPDYNKIKKRIQKIEAEYSLWKRIIEELQSDFNDEESELNLSEETRNLKNQLLEKGLKFLAQEDSKNTIRNLKRNIRELDKSGSVEKIEAFLLKNNDWEKREELSNYLREIKARMKYHLLQDDLKGTHKNKRIRRLREFAKNHFPFTRAANDALNEAEKLETDWTDFLDAKKSGTIQAYEDYISKNRPAIYETSARKKISEFRLFGIKLKELEKTGKLEDLSLISQNTPSQHYTNLVLKKIELYRKSEQEILNYINDNIVNRLESLKKKLVNKYLLKLTNRGIYELKYGNEKLEAEKENLDFLKKTTFLNRKLEEKRVKFYEQALSEEYNKIKEEEIEILIENKKVQGLKQLLLDEKLSKELKQKINIWLSTNNEEERLNKLIEKGNLLILEKKLKSNEVKYKSNRFKLENYFFKVILKDNIEDLSDKLSLFQTRIKDDVMKCIQLRRAKEEEFVKFEFENKEYQEIFFQNYNQEKTIYKKALATNSINYIQDALDEKTVVHKRLKEALTDKLNELNREFNEIQNIVNTGDFDTINNQKDQLIGLESKNLLEETLKKWQREEKLLAKVFETGKIEKLISLIPQLTISQLQEAAKAKVFELQKIKENLDSNSQEKKLHNSPNKSKSTKPKTINILITKAYSPTLEIPSLELEHSTIKNNKNSTISEKLPVKSSMKHIDIQELFNVLENENQSLIPKKDEIETIKLKKSKKKISPQIMGLVAVIVLIILILIFS